MDFKGSNVDQGIGCILAAIGFCLNAWAIAGFPGLQQ
jgi:uncharacterized membrane protein